MLAFTWIALRFIHFTSLMLVFGFAMYGAWLAPLTIRRLLAKRFLRLQQHAAVWSLISATAMLAVHRANDCRLADLGQLSGPG